MTTVKIKRKAIPMTPEVMQKFKEYNEKLALEKKILDYMVKINTTLDTKGSVKDFLVEAEDIGLVAEISKGLTNAGWTVDTRDRAISVWID